MSKEYTTTINSMQVPLGDFPEVPWCRLGTFSYDEGNVIIRHWVRELAEPKVFDVSVVAVSESPSLIGNRYPIEARGPYEAARIFAEKEALIDGCVLRVMDGSSETLSTVNQSEDTGKYDADYYNEGDQGGYSYGDTAFWDSRVQAQSKKRK